MRLVVLLSSLMLLIVPTIAFGHTWVVDPGGGGDSPNIAYALELASAGDTVLVTPGEYAENLRMKDEVALVSSGGREVTRIVAGGIGLSVIRCVDLVNGAVISGFTIVNGGTVTPQAGIECLRSSVEIFENKFEENTTGVSCVDGGYSEILDNIFTRYRGIWCDNSSPLISGNLFQGCDEWNGAGVACLNGAVPEISGNSFIGGVARRRGGAIKCENGCWPVITGNVFCGNVAWGAGGAIGLWDDCHAEIESNVFSGNLSNSGDAIQVSLNSTVTCRSSTFYAQGNQPGSCTIGCNSGSAVTLEKCILAYGDGIAALRCWDGGSAALDCNDFWSNTADYDGCTPGPSDFYENPRLCDPEYGDFNIDEASGCAPDSSPPGCGLVGAKPVGCSTAGVPRRVTRPSSWSAIKSLYR